MSIEWAFNLDLKRVATTAAATAPPAAGKAMEHIRAAAVALTPVETGHLAGTATVTVDGDTASVTFDGPYARYQHEGLDFRHEHGQAKFLEQPMNSERDTALAMIAKDIREAL